MSARAATVLVDFGSTFTKVKVISEDGELVGVTQHRTTIDTDILEGMQASLRLLEDEGVDCSQARTTACSSAGGGLWMGVVGLVDDLTAEAGRQAALGAGARTLDVIVGGLDRSSARDLLEQDPDIVLLVGGTDGGDGACLTSSAEALAEAGVSVPVVLAGNVEAQPDAERKLLAVGAHVTRAENVMPGIGSLKPESVREVIREIFINHVIGGKLGGSTDTLRELVRMATPDAVLRGVELLATVLEESGRPGGVIAVDIGGATTDAHSWVPEIATTGMRRALSPQARSARTVEADLGMRWNAPGIVEAGRDEDILTEDRRAELEEAADRRAADPGFLPATGNELEVERELARTAIAIALRRHAGRRRIILNPHGAVISHDGRDLSEVPTLIALGGVLRGMSTEDLDGSLELAHRGREERLLSERMEIGIDRRGVITAAGLLAEVDPEVARQLLRTELPAIFSAVPQEIGGKHAH